MKQLQFYKNLFKATILIVGYMAAAIDVFTWFFREPTGYEMAGVLVVLLIAAMDKTKSL